MQTKEAKMFFSIVTYPFMALYSTSRYIVFYNVRKLPFFLILHPKALIFLANNKSCIPPCFFKTGYSFSHFRTSIMILLLLHFLCHQLLILHHHSQAPWQQHAECKNKEHGRTL